MWIRNLWTAYFISWMFLAPSKLCMQTKLGLKDFPCVCNTGPNWTRLFSPDVGLTLHDVINLKPHCCEGLHYTSDKKRGCFWQVSLHLHFFLLKRYGSFLVCRFLDPHPLRLGEEGVRGKTEMTYNDFSRRSFLSTFFPLPEMVVTLEMK